MADQRRTESSAEICPCSPCGWPNCPCPDRPYQSVSIVAEPSADGPSRFCELPGCIRLRAVKIDFEIDELGTVRRGSGWYCTPHAHGLITGTEGS